MLVTELGDGASDCPSESRPGSSPPPAEPTFGAAPETPSPAGSTLTTELVDEASGSTPGVRDSASGAPTDGPCARSAATPSLSAPRSSEATSVPGTALGRPAPPSSCAPDPASGGDGSSAPTRSSSDAEKPVFTTTGAGSGSSYTSGTTGSRPPLRSTGGRAAGSKPSTKPENDSARNAAARARGASGGGATFGAAGSNVSTTAGCDARTGSVGRGSASTSAERRARVARCRTSRLNESTKPVSPNSPRL